VSPKDETGIVRVNERETGFFEDLEDLLERLVPLDVADRERLVRFLVGPRTRTDSVFLTPSFASAPGSECCCSASTARLRRLDADDARAIDRQRTSRSLGALKSRSSLRRRTSIE